MTSGSLGTPPDTLVHREKQALLFPGQGSYRPGCVAHLADHGAARDVLRHIDGVVLAAGREALTPMILDIDGPGPDELVARRPYALQLAVFASSLALHTARTTPTPYPRGTAAVLGHSFGDVTAMTAAGLLSLPDAASVVCARTEAVERFAPPGGMTALGLGRSATARLLTALDAPRLCVASTNSPRQTVVSGPHEDLARLEQTVAGLGTWSVRLQVPYPYHHPSLGRAARHLRDRLTRLRTLTPHLPVYSDVLCRRLSPDDDIAGLLSAPLEHPSRLLTALRRLHGDGIRQFTECGPGTVLTELLPECLPADGRLAYR
ncbi:ACP S-malonyltransferase [Embleya sp. AB8]|uniref:ACP S-malonyltransferase n=1 Tax=Embleya sp. AB8 TaxID=3156304 RepID=UPI003C789972